MTMGTQKTMVMSITEEGRVDMAVDTLLQCQGDMDMDMTRVGAMLEDMAVLVHTLTEDMTEATAATHTVSCVHTKRTAYGGIKITPTCFSHSKCITTRHLIVVINSIGEEAGQNIYNSYYN